MTTSISTYFARVLGKLPIVRIGRLALFVFSFTVVLMAAYRYYGVGGSYTTTYQFDGEPTSISEFTPAGRALARETNNVTNDHYQRIIGDLVYFTAKLPSAYPSATVTIEYQNPYQSLVELGLKLNDDANNTNYDWKTIQSTLIDQWPGKAITGNGGLTVLQPVDSANSLPTYESVEQFLAEPPQLQQPDVKIATLQAGIDYPFTLDSVSSGRSEYATPLQGMQELYVYISGDQFDFSIQTNEQVDSTATIRLRRFGETVLEGEHSIQASQLAAGVYEVQIITEPMVVISSISTSSPYLIAKGKVQFAPFTTQANVVLLGNTATVIANDTTGIGVFLASQAELQTGEIQTETIGVPVKWRNPLNAGQTNLQVLGGSTVLADAPISLQSTTSVDPVFNPRFGIEPLTAFTRGDVIDYILYRDYVSPTTTRGWTETATTFDLTKVRTENPEIIQFALSMPGLDTLPQGVTVRKITVHATKEPITIKNLWNRIKGKLHL